jgi:hypothetical protein
MPVDKWKLLAWMASREEEEPAAPTTYGSRVVETASALNEGGGDRFEEVARAAGQLKNMEYIDWTYQAHPLGRRQAATARHRSGSLPAHHGHLRHR